ncbi:hypothetical protein [Paenibacillus mesophilus]|uniref:hypothetical protein n=1 Tax=Paenibacillus mesophilus TaxID=2582849 RepID=UPI0013053329|nr:hypothetical protein [Paenibacillus mesophilus]
MKVAFILFDNMTVLDFVGIYDAFMRLCILKLTDTFRWSCRRRLRMSWSKFGYHQQLPA